MDKDLSYEDFIKTDVYKEDFNTLKELYDGKELEDKIKIAYLQWFLMRYCQKNDIAPLKLVVSLTKTLGIMIAALPHKFINLANCIHTFSEYVLDNVDQKEEIKKELRNENKN